MSAVIRLHVTAEGKAEEGFVKRVLAPTLSTIGVFPDVRTVLTGKDRKTHRQYRGGLVSYQKAKADIVSWLRQDNHPECRFTTMFDLYALPADFPGHRESAKQKNPYQKVKMLETAMAEDIGDTRLIPYIQLHEFEALILADPQKLGSQYLEHDRPIRRLIEMVADEGGNPEMIDEGASSAPSKRILKEIPEYNKANVGPIVADIIGLKRLREKCLHFDEWFKQLEQLAPVSPDGSPGKGQSKDEAL